MFLPLVIFDLFQVIVFSTHQTISHKKLLEFGIGHIDLYLPQMNFLVSVIIIIIIIMFQNQSKSLIINISCTNHLLYVPGGGGW